MANVILHIYDVSTDTRIGKVNEYLEAMGTGAFHGGVEVYGVEWSYGYCPDSTGVFCCDPKGCSSHHFRESIDMGETKMSKAEVDDLVLKLKATWPGLEYDLLRHNCVLFSSFFCEQLGVGAAPAWVTNLAGAGATLADGFNSAKAAIEPLAVIAAAKAGEINEKYDVSGKAQAGAKAILEGAGKFDEEYKVREKTFAAAAAAGEKAKALKAEADGDGDGQLSMDELSAFFRQKAEKTPDFLQAKTWEMKEGATAMAGAIKKAMDVDGDGQVSFKEASDFMAAKLKKFDEDNGIRDRAAAAVQAAKDKAAALHKAADADGDGKLSAEEAKEFAQVQAGKCVACEGCVVQ